VGKGGSDLQPDKIEGNITPGVMHLKRRRQTFRFFGVESRPALSINRGFSAPVSISMAVPAENKYFLARNDQDEYARWQALNEIVIDDLMAASRAARGGKKTTIGEKLTGLLAEIATSEDLEPAYRAQMLTLPTEADIAREMGEHIEPDAIFAARQAMMNTIATANRDTFEGLYARFKTSRRFSLDAKSAGKRALANTLLDYLTAIDETCELAQSRFETAANMTDRLAGLTALVHQNPESDAAIDALSAYERQFGEDPLAMDKWFQVQATAPGARASEIVRGLMRHPRFSITNPNRVRALVFTFASTNQTGFHAKSGAGYDLLADTVMEIDPRNPQLAAKLATNFRSWRSIEAKRQDLARKALVRIAGEKSLSPDVRDIIDRTLA
jgi:aminopeptidase N